MKIPANRLWTQTNEGEVTGVLNSTRNVALDNIGQIKLARKPVALYTSASDPDLKYTMAIVWFNNKYQAITSDSSYPIFQGLLDGSTWSQNSTYTPSCTLGSDAVIFKDATATQLIVSQDTALAKWNGGGTVNLSAATGLTSGVPHPMAVFESDASLAVGDGNSLKVYDSSYSVIRTLTIPSQYRITTVRYRNGYLYAGTKHLNGGEARIFIWNGSGSGAQYECPVGAEWVFSMTEYGTSVAAITSEGELIQVSGSQYIQLAALPVYFDPHATWQDGTGLQLNGKVFNRGMKAIGQNIYINVDGEVDTGFVPGMRSGLWVYEPNVGLYHRATSTTDELVRDTTFSVSSNVITTSAAHNLKDGDGVVFSIVSGLSGLRAGKTYYVSVLSSTTFKVSQSRDALARGDYAQITGSVSGDVLNYFPNTDNGLQIGARSGALCRTTLQDTPVKLYGSEVLWGTRTKNTSGTAIYAINTLAEANNIGSFTTQRIYTDNIEQSWKELTAFLDGVVSTNDKIIIKVATKAQNDTILVNGAWADSITINNTNLYDYNAFNDVQIGDEIVFIDGKGQGKTAHVTDKSSSVSTVSLVIDESYGSAGTTVSFYRTNFQKIGSYGSDNKQKEYIQTILEGVTSPWIKIKVELRGNGTAVNMFDLSHVIQKTAK